jgi:hypothetical protein
MSGLVLFETTESVIEVLWDIALAFFIVRLSLVYFILAFSSSLLVSYIWITTGTWLSILATGTEDSLTTLRSELALMLLLLLTCAACARFTIWYYEIPKVTAFRLAIGGLAGGYMAVAILIVGAVLYEKDMTEWILESAGWARGGFVALLGAYVLMPVALMALEGAGELETSHGHETKSLLDAV